MFSGCMPTAWFVSDLVGNSEDSLSHDAAHYYLCLIICLPTINKICIVLYCSILHCLKINVLSFFDALKQNKTRNRKKMDRAVPLNWAN